MALKIKTIQGSDQLLKVESNFATLLDIESDGTFVYEFSFYASSINFLKDPKNNNCVEVIVHKNAPKDSASTLQNIGRPGDLRRLTNDILKSGARSRDNARRLLSENISRSEVDLYSKISKDVTSLLASREVNINNIIPSIKVIDTRKVGEIKENNYQPAVLQTSQDSFSIAETQKDTTRHSINLLLKGKDPTRLFFKSSNINGTFSNMSGVSNFIQQDWSASSKSQNMDSKRRREIQQNFIGSSNIQLDFNNDLSDDDQLPVVINKKQRFFRYEKITRIQQRNIQNEDFFVEFKMKSDDGRTRDRVVKKVLHQSLLKAFSTPRLAPHLSISPFQAPGKNIIEIEQMDERASSVSLYKRTHTNVNLDMINNEYQQIIDLPLRKEDGVIKFVDLTNNSSAIQYRAIAVASDGILGTDFENIVTTPVKISGFGKTSNRTKAVSLSPENVPGGINIDVSNIAHDVISIAILKKNLTANETKYSVLQSDSPTKLVVNGLGDVNFLDEDVKNTNIYEYSALLYYEDGVSVQSSTAVQIRFITSKFGEADIVVDGPEVVRRGSLIDVQFNVKSLIKEQNLDAVKLALERQGLSDLFNFDLEKERDKLQKLIAHSIKRIDLTTGESVEFSTFLGEEFSDYVEGIKVSARQLIDDHKYRYIINTLLRSAETLFDDFQKESVDQSTGRSYKFSPAKFRHPITLERGALVNRESLNSNHPEDDFSFGIIGNSRTFDIDIPLDEITLRDISISRIDRRNISLRWTVDGPKRKVEHYIITKTVLGMTSIAGKVHHISSTSSFEFFDTIEPDDIGNISYNITPILNNFKKAPVSATASLQITDGRI